MTKPCMPMSGRNTDTAERSKSRWWIKCIKSITQATSKQNVPSVPILNKKMETVKFSKDIIVTSKLWNGQQITCNGGDTKDIKKMQFLIGASKKRCLTNM